MADIFRLSRHTLVMVLGPRSRFVPLGELALACSGKDQLEAACDVVGAGRARQLRLMAAAAKRGDQRAAQRRLVRALFWFMVYELVPERWDDLASIEPVHPRAIEFLKPDGIRILELGAGSGRLTLAIAGRASQILAIEPSPPLRRMLRRRLELVNRSAAVVAATTQALPVPDGWADLAVACSSCGPDAPLGGPRALREMRRCVRDGGMLVLIGPRRPSWFVAHGFKRQDFGRLEMNHRSGPTRVELERFFGRLRPPHEIVFRKVRHRGVATTPNGLLTTDI